MMPDFGAIAGGFQGGISGGMDLMAKRRALIEQAQQQAAQRAIGQGQINAAGQPPQPGPGGPPMQAPMPGAQPMPQMGGGGQGFMPQRPLPPQGPTDPGMSVPRPGGQQMPPAMPPHVGMGGPPPAAMMRPGGAPQGAPPPSPGQPPAGGPAPPPAFSGISAPTGQGDWADSGQSVNRVFQELIKQNPDLKKDPGLLFAAAEQQIGLMKGVGSDVKTMMQAQIALQKNQYNYDSLADRHSKWVTNAQNQLQMLDERLADKKLDRTSRVTLQQMRDDTLRAMTADRVAATERGQDLSLEGRREGYDASADRTELTTGERGREADNRDASADYRTATGSMGADPKAPQARRPIQSQRPTQLPRRGGQAAGRAAPQGGPPPEALKHLKEGTVTTFGNGQKWTLKGGKPTQVQ